MKLYLAVVILLIGPLHAGQRPAARGGLEVHVTDTSLKPIHHATARVLETGQGAYTDPNGVARILKLPPGRYSIEVSRLGFVRDTVRNVKVDSGNVSHLAVTLKISWDN
jgi:hypothetical protein